MNRSQWNIDSTDLSVDIIIDITVDTFGVDSFKLYNYGEGLLRWNALSRHITSEPLSVKPALDYPVVEMSSTSSIDFSFTYRLSASKASFTFTSFPSGSSNVKTSKVFSPEFPSSNMVSPG